MLLPGSACPSRLARGMRAGGGTQLHASCLPRWPAAGGGHRPQHLHIARTRPTYVFRQPLRGQVWHRARNQLQLRWVDAADDTPGAPAVHRHAPAPALPRRGAPVSQVLWLALASALLRRMPPSACDII
eukprot:scaffold16767_cov122-Isochrysis_galbana.AAC.5